LRHAAGFTQLPDTLADVFHRLTVGPVLEQLAVVPRQILRRWGRNDERHPGRQQTQTPTAISRARPILNESANTTTDDFSIEIHIRFVAATSLCHRAPHRLSRRCGTEDDKSEEGRKLARAGHCPQGDNLCQVFSADRQKLSNAPF
jgi:hypothetical protein